MRRKPKAVVAVVGKKAFLYNLDGTVVSNLVDEKEYGSPEEALTKADEDARKKNTIFVVGVIQPGQELDERLFTAKKSSKQEEVQ